jgi:hypothetical protein
MSILLLALALMAPVSSGSDESRGDADERVTCSVDIRAVDASGQPRPARSLSASVIPGVVFRGRVSRRDDDAPPLVFDVYNPRGQRYQALLAKPLVITTERGGHRVERVSRVREAALAVAGSSIAWTSMYGRWRVEPRLEGTAKPCGRAEYFTIQP